MSNFKLGIFDSLAGYLTAAVTECSTGVEGCKGADKACNKYYLQKYYESKHLLNTRDEDIVAQFTNSVAKLGSHLRKYDVSLGSAPTLITLMQNAATSHIDDATKGLSTGDKTFDNLAAIFNTGILDKSVTDVSGTTSGGVFDPKALNGALQKSLLTALNSALDTSSLSPGEIANGKKCLAGTTGTTGSIAPATSKACTALDLTGAVSKITLVVNITTTAPELADSDAARKLVVDHIKKFVSSQISAWIAANYDTSAFTVTGLTTDESKNLLTALHSGDVTDAEKKLFDEFFLIMKKDSAGTWGLAASSEIDTGKLGDFRVNCKMTDIDIGTSGTPSMVKVPFVVKFLPILETGTRVRYNDGQKVNTSSDKILLRKLFVYAYTDDKTKITTLLPSFDFPVTGPTDLQPDMAAILREILLRKSTPNAHIADDDEEQIDQALKDIWTRVGENTWKHKLDDKTYVLIKPDTPEFEEELTNGVRNCAAFGFESDPVRCAAFLQNIATSDHTELANIATKMNADVAVSAVAKLHPKLALAILKAFGFRRKMCKDKIAGRSIEKVQTTKEWIEKFVDKHFKDDKVVASIKTNDKLLNFLGLLTQLVNGNPHILNDGLVVETEESTGVTSVPDDLALRKIAAVQSKTSVKPVLAWGEIQSNMNKVYGSFSKGLTFDGMTTNSPFGMDNLFPQMSMLTGAPIVRGSTFGSMAGGSGTSGQIKTFLQDHQTGLEYSRNVTKIISDLIANMKKTSNKTLTDAEINKIEAKLTQFEMLERELFETAWNIQKYSQLIKILDAGNRPELITEDQIKQYVHKYNGVSDRYERTGSSLNTLISLLKDCAEGGESGEKCKTSTL
jgi:hypothetical protein